MSARRGASSLGGLVAVGLEGTRVTAAEEKAILDHGVGAFILFERNLADAAQALRLVDSLHELGRRAAGRPPLILIDDEGGLISEARRLGTPAPAAMALGALGEPGLVREWAWRTGRRLAVLGVGLVLAPVVDVNTERRNPVIGFRAYGDDPARVSRLGLAAMEGFRSAGVLPVPKHFPGHGGVSVDSHDRLPRFAGALGEADLHLAPFRAAIEAEAPAILAAHLAVPALARGSMTPASLSPEILTGLLREGMGFRGAVVTDDLGMGALSEACAAEEVPVRALAAGSDLLLYASGFGGASDASPRGGQDSAGGAEAALRALDRALAEGVLSEARVEEALARLDALAQASDEALAGATEGSCRAAGARAREESLAAFEADDRAARAHLTAVLATGPVTLPVAPGTALLLPTELEGRRRRNIPWPREAGLATVGHVTEVLRFPYNPDEDEVDAMLGALGPSRPAVIGLVARAGLPPGQADLAARALSRPGPTLPVALLNPFVLDGLSSKSSAGPSAPEAGIGVGLATFGFEPEEMAGLARVLGGHARPLG